MKYTADAAGNRDHAHQEFGREAVPERQAVLGNGRAKNGVECGLEQRTYR